MTSPTSEGQDDDDDDNTGAVVGGVVAALVVVVIIIIVIIALMILRYIIHVQQVNNTMYLCLYVNMHSHEYYSKNLPVLI